MQSKQILEAPQGVKYILYLSGTLHGHARDDESLMMNDPSAHTEDEITRVDREPPDHLVGSDD